MQEVSPLTVTFSSMCRIGGKNLKAVSIGHDSSKLLYAVVKEPENGMLLIEDKQGKRNLVLESFY